MLKKSKNQKGFSLVELMIVIGLIAMVASVILASLSSSRKSSRETTRRANLIQLQKALEGYFTANNSFPSTGGSWWGISANGGSKTTSGANAYIPGLAGTYLGALPTDPLNITTGWSGFNYRSDGYSYKLIIHDVGPESFPSSTELFYDPVRPTTAWMVCSGSTACNTW